MNYHESEALHRFSQARIHAAFKAPYLASGLFALKPKITQSNRIGNNRTFPADASWNIYIDPDIAIETPLPEFGWWLLHQISHLCRHHAARMPQSLEQARWWSLAADLEVNDDLEIISIPISANVVSPESLGLPKGRLAEECLSYIEVLDEAQVLDDFVHCDLEDTSVSSEANGLERELLEQRIAYDITNCRADQGKVSGGWQRWATEKLRPVVDWRTQLRSLVSRGLYHNTGQIDFSYRRPSRRQCSSQVILPTMVAAKPSIALIVDTSGSISNTQLNSILSEIDSLLVAFRPLHVICCDFQAYPVQVVHKLSDIELIGGGGTNLQAGITAALQLKPQVNLILVLTDGNTPWPIAPPHIPVVIALHNHCSDNPLPWWGHIVEIGEKIHG